MSGVENPRPGLEARIREARAKLGPSVVILGHHYQRDDVIQFADYRGDSLRLARVAFGITYCWVLLRSGIVLREIRLGSFRQVEAFLCSTQFGLVISISAKSILQENFSRF